MSNTIVNQFANIGSAVNDSVGYEQEIVRMYRRKLFEMSVNRFKWIGLPDSIDPRFLETTLYHNGLSVFYFDDIMCKFLALRGTAGGGLSYDDNPLWFRVTGNQFIGRTLRASECVPIWSNYSRTPDLDIVNIYSRRLAAIDRTLEINSDNARQTKVLIMDEDSRLGVENINRQMVEGVPVVRATNNMNQFITTMDLGVDPRMFEQLTIARSKTWSECMGLLGIKHDNQEKKERKVVAEVGANDEQIELVKATNLASRRYAAKQIGDLYGLQITVEYDTEIDSQYSSSNAYASETQSQFEALVGGM